MRFLLPLLLLLTPFAAAAKTVHDTALIHVAPSPKPFVWSAPLGSITADRTVHFYHASAAHDLKTALMRPISKELLQLGSSKNLAKPVTIAWHANSEKPAFFQLEDVAQGTDFVATPDVSIHRVSDPAAVYLMVLVIVMLSLLKVVPGRHSPVYARTFTAKNARVA